MLKRTILTFLASCGFALVGLGGTSLASSSSVGMVTGGDLYVKTQGTTGPWTQLTSGESATQFQMSGTRFAFVDSGGNLWLKDGVNGTWYEEMGNVVSYALSETGLLVSQTGVSGNVWYKQGESPTSPWTANVAIGASKVYLSPSEMVIIESGMLLGKALTPAYATSNGWGPTSNWTVIAQNATAAGVSDNMLAYLDNQGQTFAKQGSFSDAWYGQQNGVGQVIDNRATNVWVNGNVYCALLHNGPSNDAVACKDSRALGGGESQVFAGSGSTVNDFALGTNEIVGYGNIGSGTAIYGADYVEGPSATAFGGYSFNVGTWTTLSTTGTEIAAN